MKNTPEELKLVSNSNSFKRKMAEYAKYGLVNTMQLQKHFFLKNYFSNDVIKYSNFLKIHTAFRFLLSEIQKSIFLFKFD